MNDLISIIVPLYNVEKYLRECIESLIQQTYQNIEVILVDDGSSDSSGKICDEYAGKDQRLKVIHKENGGVSQARNVALDIAKGKYVTFVDSDDILAKNAIEVLHDEAKANDADFVVAGWHDFKENKDNIVCKCRTKKTVLEGTDTMKYFLEEKYFQSVIWAKLYLRDVIGEKRFDKNLVIAEDLDFLYQVLKDVKKTALDTNKTVYYYRVREESAMRKKYDSKFENEIKLSEKILKDIEKNKPVLRNAAIRRYQRINVSCIDKYFRENSHIDGVKHLKENLKKYRIRLSFRHFVKMVLLLHCRWGIKLIYKVLKKM